MTVPINGRFGAVHDTLRLLLLAAAEPPLESLCTRISPTLRANKIVRIVEGRWPVNGHSQNARKAFSNPKFGAQKSIADDIVSLTGARGLSGEEGRDNS